MKRTSFDSMACPIARGLERVGEWWSFLIMRDALKGLTRFDDLQSSLNIAPNILTRRLTRLVEAGLLERRLYCARPPRYEYVPTERGVDLRPVLILMQVWGNKHFAPEGENVMLVDRESGRKADVILVDNNTGRTITTATHVNAPGPGRKARAAGAAVQKDATVATATSAPARRGRGGHVAKA